MALTEKELIQNRIRGKRWRDLHPDKVRRKWKEYNEQNNTYRIWVGMKQRCLNENHKFYPKYGGRGITVCKEWMTFRGFTNSMPFRPSMKHTLDRINGRKGYCPSNCRWATRREQQINRACVNLIKGKTLTDWSRSLSVGFTTLKYRYIQYGEKALNENFKVTYKKRIKI